MIRCSLIVAVFGYAALTSSLSWAESLKPTPKSYILTKDFDGETEDDETGPAYDISGMACRPAEVEGTRACVVVNDENAGAQFFGLRDTTLTPGNTAYDLGKMRAAIRGTPPTAPGCTSGEGKFNQLDGEAVAYAEPYFYVAGSHGCTRGKRKYKLSSMVLARLRPSAAGTAASDTVSTYRLFDALTAAEPVKDYVLRDLELSGKKPPKPGTPEPNGLNIEGLAVVGDRLYAGLRAPSIGNNAYLISVPVDPLFAEGKGPLKDEVKTKVESIPLAVGKDAGIRDLAALPDGRLLVLTGPARNGLDAPYTLFIAELPSGKLTSLGTLEPIKGKDKDGKTIEGKAEAVLRLAPGRVLVMFDSLLNGAPREYEAAIP